MVEHSEELLCESCQKNRISWKKLSTSKTFWFSVIVVIVSLLTGLSSLDILVQYPHIASVIGVLLGTMTLVLRLMTSTSVLDIKEIVKSSTTSDQHSQNSEKPAGTSTKPTS